MSVSVVIRFTDPTEFVNEVCEVIARTPGGAIEGGAARVAATTRPSGPAGALTRLTIHAGVIAKATGRPILLERELGDLWDHPDDEPLRQRGDAMLADLRRDLEACGLRVSGGLIELRETRPER